MVINSAIDTKFHPFKLHKAGLVALTGGGGFDQCPAPLAGPRGDGLSQPPTDPK